MQYISLNEKIRHGTQVFPFDYYYVDHTHPRFFMNYHWHTEYELIRVDRGLLCVTLNEKTIEAHSGDLIFVHGGILHSGTPSDENCVYECLVFDLNIFRKCTAACTGYIDRIMNHSALVYHHFPASDDALHGLADCVFDSFQNCPQGYELAAVGYMFAFFSAVFANHQYLDALPASSGKEVRRILKLKNVVDYMSANLGNDISLEQLAKVADMSPKYFCHFFHEMTHQKPIDYLNRERIEHACNMLIDTDNSITEISLSCGFNDVSYFIRTFRRYTGSTPGKYRKK